MSLIEVIEWIKSLFLVPEHNWDFGGYEANIGKRATIPGKVEKAFDVAKTVGMSTTFGISNLAKLSALNLTIVC